VSWKKVKIGEFLFERKGLIDPNNQRLFSIKKIEKIDFSEGKIFLSDYSPTKTKQIIVKRGDFVFSGLNIEKGAVAINDFDQELVVSANYSTCEVDYYKVDQNFLKFFIKSQFFKNLLKENLKKDYGFTRPKHLMNLEILLPSLQEQKQIAEKLKHSEAKQKAFQTQIANQKIYLKNLKKQILQDAIEGKLTADWREQNPNIEPASELLKKIKQEKEKLIAEKKIKKEKPLPKIEENEVPFELPKGWVWVRLGELGVTQTGTTPPTEDESNFGNYIPFIKPADIKVEGIIDYSNEGLSEKGLMKGRLITSGSVLVVCIGGSIGKLAECKIDVSCNQQINAISPIFIRGSFVKYVLSSVYFQKSIWRNSSGATTPIINKSKWENILLPLPPLSEQLAIVSKLQTLMQKLNEAEKQIEKSLETSRLLTKAILAEAFSFS